MTDQRRSETQRRSVGHSGGAIRLPKPSTLAPRRAVPVDTHCALCNYRPSEITENAMTTVDQKLQELQREASVTDMLEIAMKAARELGIPNPVLSEYRSRVERQARSLLIDALLASHRQRGPACEVLASLRAIDRAEGSLSEDAPEYISDHWVNVMQVGFKESDAINEG
jgi:hypothetical protein